MIATRRVAPHWVIPFGDSESRTTWDDSPSRSPLSRKNRRTLVFHEKHQHQDLESHRSRLKTAARTGIPICCQWLYTEPCLWRGLDL